MPLWRQPTRRADGLTANDSSLIGEEYLLLRIEKVSIENYRCLQRLDLEIDDLTVLIGANSTGKSSVLRALRWFFEGGDLEPEDVCGMKDRATVSVAVTFGDLTADDRDALAPYGVGETAMFRRTWSVEEGGKLTGHAMAYPPFEEVRRHEKAADLKKAYGQLRKEGPHMSLPSVGSRDAAMEAMLAWEAENPDELEPATSSATHLFGTVGQPKLRGRFDYVFVPAVSDAEEQTRHARGTLMQQVVSRSVADRPEVEERLKDIHRDASERVDAVLREEHGDALWELSERFTGALREYVPSGKVSFVPQPPELKMPTMQVGLRVMDGGLETGIGRQGHGFQRALLMAAVQELARVADGGGAPSLFLAVEEPELYQHPAQARHFANTLARLPRSGAGAIQVAYATHSEHFVDPVRYERLRRFRKEAGHSEGPTARVTSATVEGVAERLAGLVSDFQVPKKVAITMRRTLSEAVFGHAVLLVEGRTDMALLSGVADRQGGFDAMGVAVVQVGGKTNLAVAFAILEELGVPTFLVFDGDRGVELRGNRDGKDPKQVRSDKNNAARWNSQLLSLVGGPQEDWPESGVFGRYAVFGDRVEEEIVRDWPDVAELADRLGCEPGEWRPKSEDCYRQAARDVEGAVPAFAAEIVAAVKGLR